MIWLALIIPLIGISILAWKFKEETNLFEYILAFIIPIICIFVGKYASVHSQTKDVEFWNTYAKGAMHQEEWKERWTEIETYTTTDSKGRSQTHTRTVTKRRTNPERWDIHDNMGNSYRINKSTFNKLCIRWNNKAFKDMHRDRNTSHTITKDGDVYVTEYDKIFEHTFPLCKQHSYENKVQCSTSIFNFMTVKEEDKAKYKLFDYPKESLFGFNPILGGSDPTAILRLQNYNALNGSRRQLHMMLVILKDQPLEAGLFQESYWKGGNKNEFIVCVGVSGKEIKWTKIISWTEQYELKVRVAREIKEMKELDEVKIVDYMGTNIPKGFIRKEFKDFSYISVKPTMRATIITYVVTLLSTLIICIIAVMNSHGFGTFISNRRRRRKRGFRY